MTLSFTHKNTDIKIREKLSFSSQEKLLNTFKILVAHDLIEEVIILSTCNRVEIITSVKEYENALDFIFRTIAHMSDIDKEELEDRADVYKANGAIRHLFSVASSLDSLVVGETQIVGQLKEAFKFSCENGFCGKKLSRAINYAFKCAAAVRSSTEISKNPVSVSSVAVSKAKELVGELDNKTAVIIGSGEMSELAARHLIAANAKVLIVNRSLENAQKLVEKLGEKASCANFSTLREMINTHCLIFSATSSSTAIIDKHMIEQRDFDRYFFDIAVPRDIDLEDSDNIHVYAVDDLEEVVSKNLALREEQAKVAYSIVGDMTNEFFKWLQTLLVDPIIKEIREKARISAQTELQKAIKKGYINEEMKDDVEKLIHQVFNQFLHKPTINLKKISELPDSDKIATAIQYFFDIEENEKKSINLCKCEYQMENNK
jgi:glutamyl-tRNA reductase